jgi:hypothetical protein
MRSSSVPGSSDCTCQRGEVVARPNSNEPPAGFGEAPPIVSDMSNLAPRAATARVAQGTVRLVVAAAVLSWFGMIIHDRMSLPELSLLSPEVVLPTVVSVALVAAWWAWPGRLSFGLLFGWTMLHFAVGGILSVLPLPFLPFVPEQTIKHYVAHALYAGCQLPLLLVLIRYRPGRAR